MEAQFQYEIPELIQYAEFLVWVEAVDTGFIENAVADAVLEVTYREHNATEAVGLLWRSEALYQLFLASRAA